jgi:hypothetical protein
MENNESTWGRTLSGKISHIVPTGADHNQTVKAECGLKITLWWTSETPIGRACPKCLAA